MGQLISNYHIQTIIRPSATNLLLLKCVVKFNHRGYRRQRSHLRCCWKRFSHISAYGIFVTAQRKHNYRFETTKPEFRENNNNIIICASNTCSFRLRSLGLGGPSTIANETTKTAATTASIRTIIIHKLDGRSFVSAEQRRWANLSPFKRKTGDDDGDTVCCDAQKADYRPRRSSTGRTMRTSATDM